MMSQGLSQYENAKLSAKESHYIHMLVSPLFRLCNRNPTTYNYGLCIEWSPDLWQCFSFPLRDTLGTDSDLSSPHLLSSLRPLGIHWSYCALLNYRSVDVDMTSDCRACFTKWKYLQSSCQTLFKSIFQQHPSQESYLYNFVHVPTTRQHCQCMGKSLCWSNKDYGLGEDQ